MGEGLGMTGRQKLALVAGVLVAAAAAAFPPWGIYDMGSGAKTDSVTFAFVLRPPTSEFGYSPERAGFMPADAVQIEWSQLAFRLVVVVVLTMILFSMASRRGAERPPESRGEYHVSRVFGPDD
jgi:hypothetical protein